MIFTMKFGLGMGKRHFSKLVLALKNEGTNVRFFKQPIEIMEQDEKYFGLESPYRYAYSYELE